MQADTNHELNFRNVHLQADLMEISRKLDNYDTYFNQLTDRFDGLLSKMMGMKEVIAKVQGENDVLVSERASMTNRAAVAFTELTPRPKYHQLLGISLKCQLDSTSDIFSKMLDNSALNTKELISKIAHSKTTNTELEEVEVKREKIVDDIIESKKKMKLLKK